MQRIIFVVVLMFSLIAGHAQSKDCEEQIANLTQRVESLESEVAYLKLVNELNSSLSDLGITKNELYSTASNIKMDILFNNFDKKLGISNELYYESAQDKFDSTENLVRLRIEYAKLMLVKWDFLDMDKSIIVSYCDALEKGIASLKETLAILKICVEEYNKHI